METRCVFVHCCEKFCGWKCVWRQGVGYAKSGVSEIVVRSVVDGSVVGDGTSDSERFENDEFTVGSP